MLDLETHCIYSVNLPMHTVSIEDEVSAVVQLTAFEATRSIVRTQCHVQFVCMQAVISDLVS